MEDPPLNPSQQVERIREILVGRQMSKVEDRLRNLEETITHQGNQVGEDVAAQVSSGQAAVLEETQQLRQQIQQESQLRRSQIERLSKQLETTCREINHRDESLQKNLNQHLEKMSSAMAARIDTRVRELLQHLRSEMRQWKGQVDRDLGEVREQSVSRSELKERFARLASAAMEDHPKPGDGFLL